MLANIYSVFAASASNIFPSSKTYFYKSRAFISPDASALPPLEKVMPLATHTFNSKAFYIHREITIPSLVHEGIQSVEGRWVSESSNRPLRTSPPMIPQGSMQSFGFSTLPVSCKPSSNQFSTQSSAAAARAKPTLNTTACPAPVEDSRDPPYSPRPTTHHVDPDVVLLRLTGEKMAFASPGSPMASETSSSRMKAAASWAARFIYALIPDGRLLGEVTSAYDTDVYNRVTRRIFEVLKSTSLPPLTMFLVHRFPFAVSAVDGVGPRAVFYHLLCGNGSMTTEDTIFRAFIVGVMLANKTNDDFPLSIREWNKAPLHGIDDPNLLELSALKALGWNVVIDLQHWNQWMDCITNYHTMVSHDRVISREYGVFAGIIDRVKRQDPHWDCHCESTSTLCSSVRFPTEQCIYADALGESLPVHSQPYQQSHGPFHSSPWISDAASATFTGGDAIPWCPAADPILPNMKPSRTMGVAPGMG